MRAAVQEEEEEDAKQQERKSALKHSVIMLSINRQTGTLLATFSTCTGFVGR